MTAMNLNRAIRGPVTAVPVVAGKGVRIVPDTVNNRFVVEADETVLYSSNQLDVKVSSINLSESPTNFERIKIYFGSGDIAGPGNTLFGSVEFYTSATQVEAITLSAVLAGASGDAGAYHFAFDEWGGIHTDTWTHIRGAVKNFSNGAYAPDNDKWCNPYKIIGINRISST